MELLQTDPEKVECTYFGSVGNATGAPDFINLNNVMWVNLYSGESIISLTMVNGGTWQLKYHNHNDFVFTARQFYRDEYKLGSS